MVSLSNLFRVLNMRKWLLLGLVAMIALTPFQVWASDADSGMGNGYPMSYIDIDDDDYIRFGDSNYPPDSEQGITIQVDEQSISSQWVDIYFEMCCNQILERSVDKFLILANGKIVHHMYPQIVDDGTGNVVPATGYRVKPSIPEMIGGLVSFQIVAVDESEHGDVAVGWSVIDGPYQFDPLPVDDDETQNLLTDILYKLMDFRDDTIQRLDTIINRLASLESLLSSKLDALKQAIEKIYTPSQQAKDNFDRSLENLLDKMPMNEMTDQIQDFNNALEDSKNRLDQPMSKLEFGGEFEFIPGDPRTRVVFMDLTPWKDQVKLFRDLMEATLWVYFIYMLMKMLTPKLRL